jgi:hypothetical protein
MDRASCVADKGDRTMKKLTLMSAALLLALAWLPAGAETSSGPVTCADGTTSSKAGKGACSHHGGVKKDGAATESAGAAAPAATTSGAGVTCGDGTTSSKSGKGACSHHGGVQKSGGSEKSTASTGSSGSAKTSSSASGAAAASTGSAASAAAGNSNASGATAKCKDGTFSHSKQHSGACSHHGGVAQWLDNG